MGLLDEAGVDPTTAAWTVDLISLHVTAIAAEQSHRRMLPDSPLGPIARAIDAVSADKYPRIFSVREELLAGNGQERSTWAMDAILNGILQTPRIPTKRGAKRAASARKKVPRGR